MKLLILGNTTFLGRAIIEQALAMGHSITVLNRTAIDRNRLTQVEWIDGTTETHIERLAGKNYDAVIDLSAGTSYTTLRTALALADRVGHYCLVSSISVYRDFASVCMDETYPTAQMATGTAERMDDYGTYGARLAMCEQRVAEAMPDRAMILRAGFLTGPNDTSDRLPRLIRRIAQGGDVLLGSSPMQPVQLLDVRDLAGFLLNRAELQIPGLLNAAGPETTISEVAEKIAEMSDVSPNFYYCSDDYLARQGIQPLSQLPLWVPQKTYPGFFQFACARAKAAGLLARPLNHTLADTIAYVRQLDTDNASLQIHPLAKPPTATLPRGAEQRLIDDYKKLSNGKHTPPVPPSASPAPMVA